MSPERKILSIGIDSLWTPMDLARLLHIIVRFYRLEQLVHLSQSGGPNVFRDRFNAVVLKHLAAFDWIAAPLMSAKFNETYIKSENFIRDFGLSDLRITEISYSSEAGAPGQIAFSGIGAVIDRIFDIFDHVLGLRQSRPFIGDDSQGKIADIEVKYAAIMREKTELMAEMGYSDAELHAIVSPSIEDLHFVSNAMALGKIVTVENS